GAGGGVGGCTSKRAKLTSRSLSRLSDEAVNSMGIIGGGDMAGMAAGGGGPRTHAGLHMRGKVMSAGSVLDTDRRHGHFEQTEEGRAMSKALRILGVDSLEERDVEDRIRASTDKAARILGVDNLAELQQNVARDRQNWAPPRSSASKSARMPGVLGSTDDLDDGGGGEGRRGRKATAKTRRLARSRSLSASRGGGSGGGGGGARGGSGGSKPRQSNLSSLIRALEINNNNSSSSKKHQHGGSETGTSENGDGNSSLGDNDGSEQDLPRKKGGGGGRGKQETGSNRSTRATESCSSLSQTSDNAQ
ncbi:unnamed protein product, partial [Hapterophycus canaliculatus]